MNDIRNMRRGALIRWEWIILWVLISCYAVTFSYYSIQTHNSFSTGYDLANADQTIWNSAYGQFFSLSSKGKLLSRLTIHADFILAVLAPIYLVWDDVRMLLIIQSVFLALGAIPTFLIGQYVLKNNLYALVIAVLYLLNPNMQWTNMYDFHGVALAIPLLLFTFYFALRKQWKWYALFAFFSILTKEEIPLMIAMIGLYIFFFLKNKKVGLISFLFGVSWFCIVVFIVMPYVRGGQEHWVFAWYQLSGPETEGDLPKTPFVQEIAYRLFFCD